MREAVLCDVQEMDDSEDIFYFGPPCRPYSQLNQKRKWGDNPFLSDDGRAFILGARHIRDSPA